MTGHIRSNQPDVALKKATLILRDKYQIFHTTIQIEKTHPGTQIGCCDNDHENHNHELIVTAYNDDHSKHDKKHSECKHDQYKSDHKHEHKKPDN